MAIMPLKTMRAGVRRADVTARVVKTQAPPPPSAPPKAPSPGMRPRDQLRRDPEKEVSRTYRRTVYDFDYWANHRSSSRYLFNILTMPQSRIVRSLIGPVMWVLAVATAVGLDHTLVQAGTLPANLELPQTGAESITLTSFALSLLLVFRTNSSYGRFDEARKFWGKALNRSRDIVRQAAVFYEDREAVATFARWTAVLMLTLQCHLRPNEDLKKEVQNLLTEDEAALLLSGNHKVLMAMQIMSEQIENQHIQPLQKFQMHNNLTEFEDILGGCERLLRTPIPLSYTRHTSRFLLIWLTLLPVCLWSKIGWGVVPSSALIAILLLGIEEIGVEIEEPFGILPLEVIADRSRQDTVELVNRQMDTYLAREDTVQSKALNADLFKM